MGCGKSKHAVATQNTITKSKSRSIKKQDPKAAEIPKNGENKAVNDSVILNKNEILAPNKIESEVVEAEEEEVKKEEAAAVAEIVHEKKEEIIKYEELKEENKEEVKADVEERESAAVIEAVREQEEDKEIKNEELKEEKKDEVKADQDDVVSQQVGVTSFSSSSAVEKISGDENGMVKEESKVAVAEEEGNEGKGGYAAAAAVDVKGN
ncbi:probable inactive protein kinase DDB_G0270444 isoform X2 [Salvia hispanica]|uniref:probable inactive protein kinase DDB_G0270444 isoform X2 n=1 Tax=Salvia hispanica TaxID=49212 RepID=UPI0020095D6D|nr:probable inactive protein kinase DDB_G0270444 isoform X2 [Salvia hispanica]